MTQYRGTPRQSISLAIGVGLLSCAVIASLPGRAFAYAAGHTLRLGVPGGVTGNHRLGYDDPFANNCTDCHAADLKGDSGRSCFECHGAFWNPALPQYPDWHTVEIDGKHHAQGHLTPLRSNCDKCHGPDLDAVDGFALSCYTCHDRLWAGQGPPPDHTDDKDGFAHRPGAENPDDCMTCHGLNLSSGLIPSCFDCHGPGGGVPTDHIVTINGFSHKPGYTLPWESGCTDCHGTNLNDGWARSCFSCHAATWHDHDFSDRAWLGTTNPCFVCHLPPAVDPVPVTSNPVWNHTLPPSTGYNVTGDTLASVGQPGGVSLKCLSCHAGDPDGPGGNPPVGPAVDDFLGGPAVPSDWISGKTAFGFDLWQHHPVSFLYDTGLVDAHAALPDWEDTHGGLHDPVATPSGLTRDGTIAQDMLDAGGQLECTACHNQHDNTHREYLVNAKESLCFTCHTFQAPAGRHHIPGRNAPWDAFRCTLCHGSALDGTPQQGGDGVAPACNTCHNDFADPDLPPPGHHGGNRLTPYFDCDACHGDPVTGVVTGNNFGDLWAPSCYQCHDDFWNDGKPPLVNVSMADLSGTQREAITFDASHIGNPETDLVAFRWSFGDGSSPGFPSYEPTTTHTYDKFGSYTATLAVTDGVNLPQSVQFQVVVGPATTGPVDDIWAVDVSDSTPTVVDTFGITFENHSGSLVGVKDDGSLALGIEFAGVIFWMDIWMDLSGNVFWGTGDTFFGNVDRAGGTMNGVVFDNEGGVHTFSGVRP